MKYIVQTEKTLDNVLKNLETAIIANKFGLLYTHDLKQTMKNKGVNFSNECRILEICNPYKAKSVLECDMSLNMILPCKISVWKEKAHVNIGFLQPTKLISALSQREDLKVIAEEVENTIIKIINEVK